jgi:ribosomal protein L29
MKKKDLEKFKSKSVSQLNKEMADLKNKAWDTRQSILKGKEKNVRKASAQRKDLAQIATLLAAKIKEEAGEERDPSKPATPSKADKLANTKKSK